MNSETVICPHCLVKVASDRRCPNCGKVVDLGDWPEIRNFPELAPYSIDGLIAPEGGRAQYALAHCLKVSSVGSVETALPLNFAQGKSCVCLGCSRQYADIVISGAAPLHAALLRNRRTRTWWVFDCKSDTGVWVNGTRERLKELYDGDRIEIAGIKLAFRGDRIEPWHALSGGMAISIRNMTFSVPGRPRPILDRISFDIKPGEFVGVLGPSGCGKSSLVQRLVGLSDNYEGEVFVNGSRRSEVEDEFRSSTAYLPQNVELSLHDELTLEEELGFFRTLHVPRTGDSMGNEDCLSALGLAGKGGSAISSLSGGEKRRVGIALALIRKPQFLLLDEPGAGLDPASESTMMRYLRGIADQGRTVLCVTHELANINLCDKLLVLAGGHVVYFGKPQDVLGKFLVKDFASLYHLLGSGDVPNQNVNYLPSSSSMEFPKATHPPWRRVFKGYLRRSFKVAFSFRSKGSSFDRLMAVLKSPWCLRLLWQPMALVMVIRMACAYYFQSDKSGAAMTDIEMLGFCSSLAVFWIGMNNSVREFVHERVPGRCLERLNGVSYSAYMASRFSYALVMGGLQTLSFAVAIWLLGRVPIPIVESSSHAINMLPVSGLWLLPLLVACGTGVLCGLCVSAVARKELSAVAIVPNIAIMALLFSNQIIRFETHSGGYMWLAKHAAICLMPCHWPTKVIVGLQSTPYATTLGDDIFWMLLQLVVYAVLIVSIGVWFQKKNERAWDGR